MTLRIFPECPAPGQPIDWPALDAAYTWLRALDRVPQDRLHHPEGHVRAHLGHAADALVADPAWAALSEADRVVLFAAVLLHDVGKASTTRVDEGGRITSHGHAARGAVESRKLLWEMGVPFVLRERVVGLVLGHMQPHFLIDREDAERAAIRLSTFSRCDLQAILSRADCRGRSGGGGQDSLDMVSLFEWYADELGIRSAPYAFPSATARFEYFRKEGRNPLYAPHEDPNAFEVTLMCGLPGSGKSTWIKNHVHGRPVVSLDDVRVDLGISPTAPQGKVVAEARERARRLLRVRTPFVWDATSITREFRGPLVDFFTAYGARVRIVAIETSPDRLAAQNADRERVVPTAAIRRMTERWEVPQSYEAHAVEYWVDGSRLSHWTEGWAQGLVPGVNASGPAPVVTARAPHM